MRVAVFALCSLVLTACLLYSVYVLVTLVA